MPEEIKLTPVPAFEIVQYLIAFPCLRCGGKVEMEQNGPHHGGSGDHCPHCGAYYTALWEQPIEQSHIRLLEDVAQD
jgi:hypothetical protein